MAKKFPLSIAVGAVDNVSAPMRAIVGRTGALMGGLERRMGGPLSRLAANPAVGRFGTSLAGATTSARAFGAEGVRAIRNVGFAAVGAGAALYAITNATAKAGDNAAKTAAKLGVGVEALQEFRFAADRSGVEAKAFDMALLQLGRQAGEAANGQGQAVDAFRDLGVSLTDQEGKLRSVEQLMPLLADGLSKVEDETKRNAIAARIFGVRGIGMVNVLAGGSKGLSELREEARRYGLVIGEDAARASEGFIDAQTNLSAALAGTRNRIGAGLIPALTGLQNKAAAWLSGHGPKLETWATRFGERLPDRLAAIRSGAVALWDGMRPLVNGGRALIDTFGGANVVGTGLAILFGGKLLVSTVGLATSVSRLTVATWGLNAALLANPIGFVVAGVAAMVAAGYMLWKHWDKITGFLEDRWTRFKAMFGAATDWIASKLSGLTDFIPWWLRDGFDFITGGGSSASSPPSTTAAAVERIAASSGASARRDELRVSFENLPRGANVERAGGRGDGLDVNVGYAMLGTG